MIFKDYLKMKGELYYQVKRNGQLIAEYDDHNLIVDTGRLELAKMFIGGTAKYITHIGIGTNGAEPLPTDTTLQNLLLLPVTTAYFEKLTAHFDFEIGRNVANGMNIKEFGLFYNDGTMFSRLSRGEGKNLNKESDIEISGWWEIDF